jgi:hypothetical protein
LQRGVISILRLQRAHTGEVIWKVRHLRHLRHPVGSGEAEIDFEKRRAAARRQTAYARRRRLGQIKVAVVVIAADLIAAGLARGLLGSAGATREELARVGELILREAMKKH